LLTTYLGLGFEVSRFGFVGEIWDLNFGIRIRDLSIKDLTFWSEIGIWDMPITGIRRS